MDLLLNDGCIFVNYSPEPTLDFVCNSSTNLSSSCQRLRVSYEGRCKSPDNNWHVSGKGAGYPVMKASDSDKPARCPGMKVNDSSKAAEYAGMKANDPGKPTGYAGMQAFDSGKPVGQPFMNAFDLGKSAG